jgi:glycosyltransferase involved in cell wall biosynthesis
MMMTRKSPRRAFSAASKTDEGPAVSLGIVMPYYGDIGWFKTALLSVVHQTDPDWHLLILDDCYPSEEPADFVRSLADPRISFTTNAENLGISANFQQALELANADYTVIMGCDDELIPTYIARMKVVARANPEASYIQPGVAVIDEIGKRYNPLPDRVKTLLRRRHTAPRVLGGERLAVSLILGNWTYFPSICWKTSELKKFGFRQDYTIVLDLALQLEIIGSGGSLFVDDVESFRYRRHRTSASMAAAKNGLRFEEESRLFSEFSQQAGELNWARARNAARWHVTSRLNALIELTGILFSHDTASKRALWRHATS